LTAVQPEMMRELEMLQERAAQLGALARTLSRSSPDRAEGTDPTGWVKVTLDRSGLPAAIQIRNGWDQRIEPQHLAAGIADAHADAVSRGMRAWSDSLDENRWPSQRSTFDNGEAPPDREIRPLPAGQRREVSELAEEVIASLQSAQQAPPPEAQTIEGTDDDQRVTIRLSADGSVSCSIDQQWAAGRSGDSITSQLSTALSRARARLPRGDAPSTGVDGLIGDVLATLESFKNM
jgi:hypothetical protein